MPVGKEKGHGETNRVGKLMGTANPEARTGKTAGKLTFMLCRFAAPGCQIIITAKIRAWEA